MSAIQIFIWFLLYSLQLWNLSLVVVLPAMMASLLRSEDDWKRALAKELFSPLMRFQFILFVLAVLIYFGGDVLPVFGQFRDGYMAIEQIQSGFVLLSIICLAIATGGVFFCRRNASTKPQQVPNYLYGIVVLNVVFLVLFVATSSTLFTASEGQPVHFSAFDIVTRMIHVLFSAIALLGATVAFAAREIAKKNAEHAEKIAKLGLKWMLIGGSVQVFAGVALLMSIGMGAFPVPIGHILLSFGILCAIGVVIMSAMAFGKTGSLLKIARATAMTVVLTFFLMVGMRVADLVKRYSSPIQSPDQTAQQ